MSRKKRSKKSKLNKPHERDRDDALSDRLEKPLSRLIVNNSPKDISEVQGSLSQMIVGTVKVSRLNIRDPGLATQHPFQGRLKFRKAAITEFTSIFRFVCDVECLLRELYGDVDGDDLDELVRVIWKIVEEFTKHVCCDIYQEYRDAHEYQYRQSWIAAPALTHRAMQVSVAPDAHCWYTKKFVKSLKKYWPELISWTPGDAHRVEYIEI
jgi:hypothetical protein